MYTSEIMKKRIIIPSPGSRWPRICPRQATAAVTDCLTGGIDLQLLGLGHNGHIGFNEPAEEFSKTTHCVDLSESTIEANTRFFDSEDEVPRQAYTMGIQSIMQAKMILISDSMRAVGMEDGQYTLGGQEVTVHGALATLADGTIAGSATNLYDCMCKAVEMGIPKEQAIRAAAINPAVSIGASDEVGSLEAGRCPKFVSYGFRVLVCIQTTKICFRKEFHSMCQTRHVSEK